MSKIKINKFKFIRNILICIVSICIVAFILNIAPGYKRDKYKDVVNLILNEKNITENLKNSVYISEKGTIYISQEDIKELFDENIYYDEKYNQIITTSDTKVANITINNKQITINDSNMNMLEPVIKINDKMYLPISDMNLVYNIDVKYIEATNKVIIDNLNKGIIKADIIEDTEIRFKPRKLSKIVGEVKKGEVVSGFYTTSKGWREIRTEDGLVGYIKANKVTNEYILRQDMETKKDAQKVSIKPNKDGKININNENIEIMSLYEIKPVEENTKIWANVSIGNLKETADYLLSDYKKRTIMTNEIVDVAIANKVNNINIDCSVVEDEQLIKRFIVELAPKLRELGITTSVVLNHKINEESFKSIVDYIVEK